MLFFNMGSRHVEVSCFSAAVFVSLEACVVQYQGATYQSKDTVAMQAEAVHKQCME